MKSYLLISWPLPATNDDQVDHHRCFTRQYYNWWMSVFLSRPQDIPHQDVLLLLLEKGVGQTFVIRSRNFSAACPSDPSSSTSEFIGNDLLK